MQSATRKLFLFLLTLLSTTAAATAQDNVFTGTNTGADRIRIAVADFKPGSGDTSLKSTFDATLYSDLANAGIFDIVFEEPHPANHSGNSVRDRHCTMVCGSGICRDGRLRQYLRSGRQARHKRLPFRCEQPTISASSREAIRRQRRRECRPTDRAQVRRRDHLPPRCGVAGIAETKIFFIHAAGGQKEIWQMDYDGANQHAVTHLGAISLSPRISPDNTRIAFSSLGRDGFQIRVYSLLLNRMVNFSAAGGTNLSPAWSPDGRSIAYSSSRSGDPEIWITDVNGASRAPRHQLQGTGRLACLQPKDRLADRLDQRSNRPATALRHGLPMVPVFSA